MMNITDNNVVKKNMLKYGLLFYAVCMLLLPAVNLSAQDTVFRRYGLFIGSNYGGHERVTLSYAVTDARALSEVMQQLGGVMPTDSIILTDPSPDMVNHTINEIKRNITYGASKRTEFFFYYSGHSDEQGLLLGDSVYRYEDLKETIESVDADVNIAVLDSCSSGTFTRMKGGLMRSPFLSDESVDASGHAFLTSSSEDEAAQESDDLGASFFTHYFISALRGAADSTLDGTVSLNEAYSYASSETLARTEDTLAGPQHPSYDIQLAGTGDLVLTDLRSVSEQIMFEGSLRGRIFVRDSAGRLVVELKKIEGTPLAVSIGPGRYSMILDDGTRLLSADLLLTGGSKILVMKDEFYPVPRNVNTARGGTDITAADSAGDTAAELDIIAERARKRALEAAGRSADDEDFTSSKPEKADSDPVTDKTENQPVNAPGQKSPEGESGLDIGIIANAYNLGGIQIGAVGANVNGYFDGIQIGGVFATVSEDVSGIQIAGVFAAADGDVRGGQISGVWNTAHDVSFIQLSGIFNIAEGNVLGVQLGGIFNTAADVAGFQAAGIVNVAENVNGVQLGLLNFGGVVNGVQIGLINISDELYGVPLGLINISGNGLRNFSVWYADSGMVNFGYQLGTPTVYSFINAGFSKNWTDAASIGGGMGVEISGEYFFFDVDIYGKAYQNGFGSALENLHNIFSGDADIFPALRLSAGAEIFDFISIFGGVNFDCGFSTSIDGNVVEAGEIMAESYSVEPMVFSLKYGEFKMYPSFFIGVRI